MRTFHRDASAAVERAVTTRPRDVLEQVAVAVVLVAPAAVVTWAFRPGYMNADTLNEYASTQPGGDFTDWRAPMIELLWDGALAVGIGRPTIVLFAQSLCLVTGFYLVLRAALGRLAAALLSAVLFFTPLVLSQVMLLGRDTWLTSLVVFQVGCAVRWASTHGRWGRVWLAASLVAGLLAFATRQNAGALELFVLAATAARWYSRRVPERRRLRAMVVPTAAAAGASVVAVAFVLVVPRLAGARDVQPEALLYTYDLVGMSLRTDDLLIGPEAFPSQALDTLRQRFSPQAVETVLLPSDQALVYVYDSHPEAIRELGSAWRDEVVAHPGDYIAVRWTLFSRIIGVSHTPTFVMHPGVDTNPWGFALANPDANDALRDFVRIFSPGDEYFTRGSDLFRPVIYLVVAAAAAMFLLRRRRRAAPGGLEVGLLAVGAIVFEATYLFLATGESFRYSYPTIVMAVLAGTFALASFATRRGRGVAHPDDPVGDPESLGLRDDHGRADAAGSANATSRVRTPGGAPGAASISRGPFTTG
jgi:hypothetical protein